MVASFDLHVLSTPPAFILSQDQTLMFMFVLPVLSGFSSDFSGFFPYFELLFEVYFYFLIVCF